MSTSSLSDSGSTDQQLDQAIMEFLRANEDGTPLDIAALLEKHAPVADELEAFINQQIKFGKIAAPVREFTSLTGLEEPAIHEFGDYEIIREIGRGGMGVIYEARQKGLSRRVALKMIRDTRFRTQEDLVRFQSESEAAAALEHPNIVPVYRVGSFDGQPFFTMKLVRGGSLKEALEDEPMSPAESARIALAIARGVSFAHQRLILHRDLKPANILLDSKTIESSSSSHGESTRQTVVANSDSTGSILSDGLPVPMISDFGLAKQLDAEQDLGVTMTGAVLGTPRFMAPEQALAQETTTSTDIYAVGAILYNMLTGEPPFGGNSPAEVARKVVEQTPKLIGWKAKIDLDLETICMKCLEKKPADRYGSASELAEDLENWIAGKPINARRSSTFEQVRKWSRRHPRFATLLTASAALLIFTLLGAIAFSFRLNAEVKKREATLVTLKGQEAETSRHRDLALRSLFESKFAEVAARRSSGSIGQQFGALEAAKEAVAQLPFIDASEKEIFELRSETAGCLGNADIAGSTTWEVEDFSTYRMNTFNHDLTLFTHQAHTGAPLEVYETEQLGRTGSVSQSKPVASFDIGRQTFSGPDCRFSRCGNYMSVTTKLDRDVIQHVFDINSGKSILESSGMGFACFGERDSETLLATSDAKDISIYRLPGLEKIETWKNPSPSIRNQMSFSPDGNWLARYGAGGTFVIDTRNGEMVWQKHDLTTYAASDLDWHPDGKEVAIAYQTSFQIWNLESTPRLVRTFPQHSDVVFKVEYAAGGSVVAASTWGFTTYFWDTSSGEQIYSFPDSIDRFADDGRSFGFCNDRSGICEFDRGQLRRTISSPDSYYLGSQPLDLDVHPNDSWFALGERKSVRIGDLKTGKRLVEIPGYGRVRFHPDGKSLFIGGQTLRRWPIQEEVENDETVLTIGPPEIIESIDPRHREFEIDVDPTGNYLAYVAQWQGTYLVNLANNNAKPVHLKGAPNIGGISVSANGKLVAVGNHHSENCRVFDGTTGELLFVAPTPTHARCAICPNGKLLAVTYNSTADVYETDTWQCLYSIDEPEIEVAWPSSFSKDGNLLLFTLRKPRGTLIVDAASGNRLIRIPGAAGTAPRDARSLLTSDHQLVSIKAGNSVERWDLASIRNKLSEIGLDWESAHATNADSEVAAPETPKVKVVWGSSRWAAYERAMTDLSNKWSWQVAETAFKDWLADEPGNPELWHAKAVAKSRLGDQSALADIEKAIQLSGDTIDPEMYFSRAKMGRQLNQKADLLSDLSAFLEFEPMNDKNTTRAEKAKRMQATQLLAWEMGLQGKPNQNGHAALELAGTYSSWVGQNDLLQGNVQAWIQSTLQVPSAKGLSGDQVKAAKTLCLALIRNGKPDDAKTIIKGIVPAAIGRLSDSNLGAGFLLALCEAELGNKELAERHFVNEVNAMQNCDRWISLGSDAAVDWSTLKSIVEAKLALKPKLSLSLRWSPEDLIVHSKRNIGNLYVQFFPDSKQYVDLASGNEFIVTKDKKTNLFWNPMQANEKLSFELDVTTGGVFDGKIHLVRSWDYGRFEFEINGKPVGRRFDGQSVEVVFGDFVDFADVELREGTNRLTIKNVGKSGDSRGFFLGVEAIEFTPK